VDSVAPAPRPGHPRLRRLFDGHLWIVIVGAVGVTLAALWYWRIWDGGLSHPLVYEGDALLYQRLARTISQRGWYLGRNPVLGAPTGQVLYDYPLGGDNLHLLFLRLFAFGTSNPFVITNLYFYLTFPLAYAASYYSLRRLKFAVSMAVPASILYALAPYHFVRSVNDLFLSGYYAVPLGCLLLYELLGRHQRPNPRAGGDADAEPPQPLGRWLCSREFWLGRWLWVPVLLGSTGAYYGFLFVLLAAAVGALTALGGRTLRPLVRPLVVVIITLVVLAVNNAPSLVYRLQHGTNDVVAKRSIGDADSFALQPAYLLLPIEGHRIAPLGALRARADESVSPLPSFFGPALGAAAAVGFVLSLAALVAGDGDRRDRWRELARRSGSLNILALLLGSAGGGSLLLGVLGFVQLRDYGRLVVFMAFFCLVALGGSLQPLLRRVPASTGRIRAMVAVVLVGLMTTVALLDHTRPRDSPALRRRTQVRVAQDRQLASAIEHRLGKAAMVLQVPMLGFPEDGIVFPTRPNPANRSLDGYEYYNGYELFRPTLYTASLRWSYGAIENRPDDLQPSLANKPVPLFLRQAVAVGFDGIYIDRNGFPDDGVGLISQLEPVLGVAPLKSDRAVFFDLGEYRQRVIAATPADELDRLRDEARHPLQLTWKRSVDSPDGNGRFFPQLPGLTSGRWLANGAVLDVANPTASTRTLSLHATARLGVPGSGELMATAGAQSERFTVSPAGDSIIVRIVVPPGSTQVVLTTDRTDTVRLGRPTRKRTFRLEDVWTEG